MVWLLYRHRYCTTQPYLQRPTTLESFRPLPHKSSRACPGYRLSVNAIANAPPDGAGVVAPEPAGQQMPAAPQESVGLPSMLGAQFILATLWKVSGRTRAMHSCRGLSTEAAFQRTAI